MKLLRPALRGSAIGLITLALIVLVSLHFPGFATPANLAAVFDDTAILILLALGQALVILTRGIDLSAASNLALCGMIAALIDSRFAAGGAATAIVAACVAGTLLGAMNGLFIWKLKLPPIVVTLGTLSIYRGLVYVISEGAWVNSSQMSDSFLSLVRGEALGLSTLSWLALAAIAIFGFILRHTFFGRDLFAVGGNPQAAAYAGIDAGRVQFIAYSINGALAGLCGYLWVARFAVAYTDVAVGFELQVIAACLIGGVSIAGGVGTVLGVVTGSLFLGVIKNALPLAGISPFWQMGINGLVITAAAVLNANSTRTSRRARLARVLP